MDPYHSGEISVQTRAGVREQSARSGPRMIRDFMPLPHREFFAGLPYAFIACLDAEQWPVAWPLCALPGFIRSPDARTLVVDLTGQRAPRDHVCLNPGAPLGVLGIEFHSRRRNRANGHVAGGTGQELWLEVEQSFGNCPQYIQARTFDRPCALTADSVEVAAPHTASVPLATWQRLDAWTKSATELVVGADTCFLATASLNPGEREQAQGCDISHRGGRPGFIRAERGADGVVLTFPDFAGNRSFNTLGNLAVNPKIGLLVVDFDSHVALHVSGLAEVVWDAERVRAFEGAERLVRVTVTDVRYGEKVLAGRWSAPDSAKQLERTGTWLRATR